MGPKTLIYERFSGFDSHKCNRIIGLLAETCRNRTQTFGSQIAANDDIAASAEFQLESIAVNKHTDVFPVILDVFFP